MALRECYQSLYVVRFTFHVHSGIYFGMEKTVRVTFSQLIGAIEGLMVGRLVALLFAARPENWAINILLRGSEPLVRPWSWLDRWANQPRIGARLELATLAAMVVVALLAVVVGLYSTRGMVKSGPA